MALMFIGCGSDSDTSVERVVQDGEIIQLEENQTIGYLPNTNVNIYNLGDGAFYMDCNGAETCSVNQGDVEEDNDIYTDINNTTDSHNPVDSNDDNGVENVTVPPVVVTENSTTNNYTTVEP